MARIELGSGRQTFLLERTGGSDRITDFRAQYFEATLDEAQEVPPNPDIAGISGTGVGALNFARSEFDFHLEIEGIDLAGGGAPDDMTDMHIHGAAAGDTGPVIFDFRNDAETDIAAGAGTVDGSWDKNEPAALDLTAASLAALLDEETYFNIHTNRDTSGFIRGQILKDGSAADRIDLRELNIGSFETVLAITRNVGGDAVISTRFDGEETSLRLVDVRPGDLRPGHFVLAGREAEDIDGTSGRDDLFGAGGADRIAGRGGADRLFGEAGRDTLVGGRAGDRFVFVDVRDSDDSKAGADRIADFAGKDRIDLAAIDAAEDPSGNDRFAFIGDDGFDAEGQLRVMQSGGDTFVLLNTRGAGGAEAMIRIEGLVEMNAADFVL